MSPKRHSISIQINQTGNMIVRCPYYLPQNMIENFLWKKRDWIYKHYIEIISRNSQDDTTASSTQEDAVLVKKYKSLARNEFQKRCAYYQKYTGGIYHTISIRDQKTRWGSCSSKGNLSFNWRLILAPSEILDYVVVHELCHLTYMNHSKDFWNMVASIIPDYKIRRKWLKENGYTLHL